MISSSTGSFPTKTYSFSYDNLGNISQTVGPEGTTNYSYDVLSQLTQANRNNGAQVWNYSCDYFGNLKARSYAESGVTQESLTYTYGDSNWKDKLTGLSVTRSGVTTNGTYTYDAIGNPTSYFSPSDLSTWTMSWQNGRELATATNGTHALSYDYDVNGLRTYKIVDGVRHDYFYASGKLLREEWTETENGVDKACSMDFFYDYAGNPYVVFFSRDAEHQRFYYLTNLQGDVIGILNTSAQLVAEYDYDPYGNLISCTCTTTGAEIQQAVGQANPLRYRGYYFDQETGFYYLQSRYYDPAIGRFLNADSFASTGQGFLGYNMFAYCGNNPVILHDIAGNRPRACPISDCEIVGDECDYGMWFVGGFGTDGTSALSPEINPTPPVNPGGSGFGAPLGKTAALVGTAAVVGNCIAPAAYPNNPDNKDETKKRQEYFPDDPNLFMPIGLVRRDYPGTDNGSFIKWTLPLLKKEVIFEWDEDFVNGSHYHVMLPGDNGKHNGTHYYAGDPVPEPWNTLFFGG